MTAEQQSQAKEPTNKRLGLGTQTVIRIDCKDEAQLRNLDSNWSD